MKKRVSKKIFAWLMTGSMLFGLSGMTAFAEEASPVDSEAAVVYEAEDADVVAAADETQETSALPESEHNYADSFDNTWEYKVESAANGVIVSFDSQTKVESNYDFIYVYDGNDNQIGKYTGTDLAGKSLYIPTDTVKIRLTSDSGTNAWGFKVTSIEACGETIDLAQVGTVDAIVPIQVGGTLLPVVRLNGNALELNTDYTVAYDASAFGEKTATITGIGKYSGTLTALFYVYDEENLAESPEVSSTNTLLRQAGNEQSISVKFTDATDAWFSSIESVTLTPVDKNGSVTDTGSAVYPNAPKKITLEAKDIETGNGAISFTRTAENPIVYVMEGHEPIEIKGRWSTVTYPQSQIYKVTVKATGYKDAVGTTTYYTGTAPGFSIIIDADGNAETTDDQTVAKSWTTEEIAAMSTFANGSSQCGMTGFRTFSGMGVTLNDLLKDADVSVSDSDYFLLDTSDHYGNKFTYDELFNTTRYFLDCIYEDGFADFYDSLVDSDDEAGSVVSLRRYLAEQCVENESTVEPRISTNYVETLISGNQLDGAVLPTAGNTTYNTLVSYENQFRFFYGIALVQEDCAVTFDSQGGSEVAPQTVKSHLMTSTSNTTIKSSYWANSLVIYRGAGEQYKPTPSTAADTISVPEAPTRAGYVFAGWYTDADCTDGNRFDFDANDGTVDQNTTLYAKWVPEEKAITVTDFDITSVEHDDADGELDQTIIATLTFDSDIKITSGNLSKDLLITIAGGDVNDTERNITYRVKNGNQLVITLVSNDWVAIYNGVMNIKESTEGITHIIAADGSDKVVVLKEQQDNIPIGIVVSNRTVVGTSSKGASTSVFVEHKANMRGMYFFELVSIIDGEETVIGKSLSHAHNFYTSIDEAAIASAMASAINNYDGYSTTYEDGAVSFIVTADKAVAGETLAVRMVENKAAIKYKEITPKWNKNATGWWYQNADGSYPVNQWAKIGGKWYYFDARGYMQSGWQKINNKWYYLGSKEDGAMKSGWQKVNNKWYYLGNKEDGAMKSGWQKVNNKWYHLGNKEDGAMKSGWQKINNEWYYLGNKEDGAMKSGWQKISNKWYYLGSKEDGAMKSGWQKINNEWYYLGNTDDGSMKTGWQKINNVWYYMDASGAWVPGK